MYDDHFYHEIEDGGCGKHIHKECWCGMPSRRDECTCDYRQDGQENG